MFAAGSGSGCAMCSEPIQHKNLLVRSQSKQQPLESVLTLSKYETDIIPLLWEHALAKNAYFCEHVTYSWSMKRHNKQLTKHRPITELNEEEYCSIRDESKRLETMLSETVVAIRSTGKLNPGSEIFRGYARGFGWKNNTKWCLGSRRRRRVCWNLMAEALVEEFSALSQPGDVHTRQLCALIWKHFVHALSHCIRL